MKLFNHKNKAQSFVEFALILPILLLVLLGVVELTLFMGTYINLVDLTREAARFASNRDPFAAASAGDHNCSTTGDFNFFWDTACIFSPLQGGACTYSAFCNGFNSTLGIKSAEDDILVSVFTETGVDVGGVIDPQITNNAAAELPWVWSNHDPDTAKNDNWRRDCDRLATPAAANPTFTKAVMQSYMDRTTNPAIQAMANKGFVVVEALYCYHQILNIPILSQFLPNPMRIHAYTIMPLPAAQPTPTPKP
jgi:hypothetical protein